MFGENITTLNISVEEGIVVASIDSAMRCYNESGLMRETVFNQNITLGSGPFRFSDTRNKLTAFGCDTTAAMTDRNESFASACGSLCSENRPPSMNITGDSCSGIGCCQTPLPKSLSSLIIILSTVNNHTQFWQFNQCDYAFLADESFNISELQQSLVLEPRQKMKSNITIEWVAKEETCEAGKNSSDYACGREARCVYSKNVQGYRCLCKEGFRGNPYLPEGCEDVNECEEPENYPCEGTCKNTLGNYTCSCPLGMRGDGKVGCQGYRILTIAAGNILLQRRATAIAQLTSCDCNHAMGGEVRVGGVTGAAIFVVIIGVLAFIGFKQKKKERNFFENGGMILKNQRVTIFSEAELAKATKNYDNSQFLGEGAYGFVYKGVLPDKTQVAVKKSKEVDKNQINQEFQREIGIVSQINHKNIVKLLGLCLETKVPILVYEFISNENNSLNQVLGFEVSDDDAEMEEIEEVAELAKRCLSSSVKRPSMQEVAEELIRLKRLNYNFSAQQNNEETAKLLVRDEAFI
ncbi:hypothetical protein Pint_20152 [Pistacia integerrima]|uniref:Uncharacterized protein n=1 Tax=Pistacia integerrima TaxID=434235 RepID=A0ACC0XBR8_9ROSI|nr:hypothetical protein Pint_20152 [Pistacia integerrima]